MLPFFFAYREAVASFGSSAREHLSAVLRGHARPEAVLVCPLSPVRLVGSFHVDTPRNFDSLLHSFTIYGNRQRVTSLPLTHPSPEARSPISNNSTKINLMKTMFCNFFTCTQAFSVLYSKSHTILTSRLITCGQSRYGSSVDFLEGNQRARQLAFPVNNYVPNNGIALSLNGLWFSNNVDKLKNGLMLMNLFFHQVEFFVDRLLITLVVFR
jgi:hypothetical protein